MRLTWGFSPSADRCFRLVKVSAMETPPPGWSEAAALATKARAKSGRGFWPLQLVLGPIAAFDGSPTDLGSISAELPEEGQVDPGAGSSLSVGRRPGCR